MESQNKYYTPTIEEFHVGFEYEEFTSGFTYDMKHIEGNQFKVLTEPKTCKFWNKEIADWESLNIVYDDYEHQMIPFKDCYRVKYLDQEDIESLGWKAGLIKINHNEFDVYKLGNYIITSYSDVTRKLDISIIHKLNITPSRMFRGTIKNKSELKRLMKQLGIE